MSAVEPLPNTFGPSALATPANAITVIRLLLAPIAFGLIVDRPVSWLTWAVWAALACSDGLDGASPAATARLDRARPRPAGRQGPHPWRHGRPVSIGRFWAVPVAIIAVREIVISLYRSYWGRRGIAVPASRTAQGQTFAQSCCRLRRLAAHGGARRLAGRRHAVGLGCPRPRLGRAIPRRRSAGALGGGSLEVRAVPRAPRRVVSSAGRVLDRMSRCVVRSSPSGQELLLGQIVDTNSSWIGEQLALAGIDSFFQTKVGDNFARIESTIRIALDRSDAVIVCGGLGPTQDDITRDVIAAVMGVELVRDPDIEDRIRSMFGSRGRFMPDNNLRQADVPVGATIIPQMPGTAPGLVCPVTVDGEEKLIFAVPGVPWEMQEMVAGTVIPRHDGRGRPPSSAVGSSGRGTLRVGDRRVAAGSITELDNVGNPTLPRSWPVASRG